MAFSQMGYPQYLGAGQAAVYGGDRQGVLAAAAAAAAAAAGSGRAAGSELGSSSSAAVTSVLGMYASPYSTPNYSAFLPYTTDLTLFSQMGSQYELKDNPGVHPATFAAHAAPGYYPYGQFQYGDPGRPKNATRESTSTLKAWLNEHRKNPYPTKGEKIMLAIITKMTLTQVSTWFANARRRLKKENKMTWAPRNKSEDEDDDDGDGERGKEDHSEKVQDSNETSAEDEGISLHVDSMTDHSCSAESDGEKLSCRVGDHLCESGTESKDKYEDDEEEVDDDEDDDDDDDRGVSSAKPVTSSPLTGVEAPILNHQLEGSPRILNKATLDNRISPGTQTPASKPKLWSLAEIATSDLKQQNISPSCLPPSLPSAPSSSSSHSSPYPSSSILGRHIYYTSPFYSNYTNYGNFNALQSQGILRYNSAEGLSQAVLSSSSIHKHASDSLKSASSQHDQHYRPNSYDSKKDPSEVCTVGVQPYL